jgi:hypothetical protein
VGTVAVASRSILVKAAVVAAMVVSGLVAAKPAAAYSVLAHEANIDALWDSTVAPMLRRRFPEASPEQIQEARGYTYVGCVRLPADSEGGPVSRFSFSAPTPEAERLFLESFTSTSGNRSMS